MIGIKKKEGFFTAAGGIELYYHSHASKNPKGILAISHGLGEHSGRYRFLLDYFLPKGWGIYLMDHRGHGKSPGKRQHTPSLNLMVEDLGFFLKKVRRESKGLPVFLVAHSFGGQLAVNYLANHPIDLNGLVLSAPNLKLALDVPWIKKFVANYLSFFLPTLSLGNEIDSSYLSHDPKVVKAYQADPEVSHRMTLRMGSEILNNLEGIMKLAPKIRLPTLILQGDSDKVTSPEGSQDFFQKMTVGDRELKIYRDYYHEIFNEIGREKVFADMEEWLEKRI